MNKPRLQVEYESLRSSLKEEQKRKELQQLRREKEDLEKQAAELARQHTLQNTSNENPQNY